MEFPFVSKKKYNALVYKIERLLCFASGNRFSKSTYSIEDMERMVSDYQECIANEAIEDFQKQRNGYYETERESNMTIKEEIKFCEGYLPECDTKKAVIAHLLLQVERAPEHKSGKFFCATCGELLATNEEALMIADQNEYCPFCWQLQDFSRLMQRAFSSKE